MSVMVPLLARQSWLFSPHIISEYNYKSNYACIKLGLHLKVQKEADVTP